MKRLSIIFLCLFSFAFAQKTGTIRGFIYEDSNGEPLPFVNVFLKGTEYGSFSDDNGFFTFSKIPVGSYTIKISSVGFETQEREVKLTKSGQIITEKFNIKEGKTLDEVVVSAEVEERKNEISISKIKITPEDIKIVPTPGGEADLATYLQTIPGVVFTGDQGGQLYIRGGAPIQNKVILDGMTIYNPFHSIGFFSVFDTDILKTVDVYTGGFSSEYGGRTSSIMDIKTKDGNKKKFSGVISASPFLARVMLEGPLKKLTDTSEVSVSYLLSGKYSYFDQSSKTIYNYIDEDGLPYQFQDYYGKLTVGTKSGSKINFFGFSFNDRVNYQDISDLKWNSWGAGANFMLLPPKSSLKMDGHFAYSKYNIGFEEQTIANRESEIGGFDFGFDFTNFSGNNAFKYGLGGTGFKTILTYENSVGSIISQENNTTEFFAYGLFRINIKKKFILEPSIRFQYYASLSAPSLEPRLGLKWNINDKIRFKASGGMYSQNLVAVNSDRDVVNLFYGFISSPDNIQDSYINEKGEEKTIKTGLQKSNHAIIGLEYDLNNKISFNLEGYYKYFPQLVNINRNKIYPDDAVNSDKPEELKKDFIIESGDAYGIDLTTTYKDERFYFWLVYSLGKTNRFDGIQSYAPVFDRRHNINFVGSYKWGKNKTWEVNIRWNFGSGLPFTPTQGFYSTQDFQDGITTDYSTNNTSIGITYGDVNSKRMKDYHRLDFTVKKRIKTGKTSVLELNVSITNTYNRQNIFYIERYTNEKIYQLPILPSFGANWKF